jgi:putative transposase
MIDDSRQHHRRSIRLREYDYTQPGAYFVTICTQERACRFGKMVNGEMRSNALGKIVCEEWFKSADVRPNVALHRDEFVLMPNHIHGIIWIVSDDDVATVGATRRGAPTTTPPRGPASDSVGAIIGQFKSAATKRINAQRGTPGAPVWQRNYYEHIIRDEESLNRIRQYILDNPRRWAYDRNNPAAVSPEAASTQWD